MFAAKRFFLEGFSNFREKAELKDKITQNGGSVSTILSPKVDFVLLHRHELRSLKVARAFELGLTVLPALYVARCVAAGRLLPATQFACTSPSAVADRSSSFDLGSEALDVFATNDDSPDQVSDRSDGADDETETAYEEEQDPAEYGLPDEGTQPQGPKLTDDVAGAFFDDGELIEPGNAAYPGFALTPPPPAVHRDEPRYRPVLYYDEFDEQQARVSDERPRLMTITGMADHATMSQEEMRFAWIQKRQSDAGGIRLRRPVLESSGDVWMFGLARHGQVGSLQDAASASTRGLSERSDCVPTPRTLLPLCGRNVVQVQSNFGVPVCLTCSFLLVFRASQLTTLFFNQP
eukprot:TRINITY_DN14597_c0_g1_i1.p1 TRINITY_DN14597_c0_g1~~TRINITY_DN14597_c0_g1_i1.p1  ORF type:complete len:349 (-),score=91.59 TRINITY_DN14597_c0_g1_i1:109-1155(-)